MEDLISQLEMEAYEFKEPWRATNKSLTIVVPIVAKAIGRRGYVVLEEVKDKVKIVDTGRIGKVRIEGDVDKPTFIRGGTMLKGATQERATQYGIVVMPQKSEEISVQCIHASRGIRPGASFKAIGHTPRQVYSRMLASRSQSHTWNAVIGYAMSATESVPRLDVSSDDLVGVYETIHKFREDLKEILKQVPDYVTQVGTVIIDPDGVLGLEMYDHPDSWKAFSESIMRSYAEALANEDKTGIFKPDMEAIIPLIQAFLLKIKGAEKEEVFNQNNAKTAILKAKGYVGEYTTLNGKTIHLSVTRSEKEVAMKELTLGQLQPESGTRREATPREQTPRTAISTYTYLYPYPYTTYPAPPERLERKWRKQWRVLKALDKPKTWTSLRSEVPIAKATLSGRLKELQRMGAVDKEKEENGVVRYSLTGIGYEILKRKK